MVWFRWITTIHYSGPLFQKDNVLSIAVLKAPRFALCCIKKGRFDCIGHHPVVSYGMACSLDKVLYGEASIRRAQRENGLLEDKTSSAAQAMQS